MKKKRIKMVVCTAVVVVAVSVAAFLNCTYNKRSGKTVAIVNGEKIRLSDVDRRIPYVINNIKKKYGEDFEKEINKRIKNSDGDVKKQIEADKSLLISSRNKALDNILKTKSLSEKGKQLKISAKEDGDEIDTVISNIKKETVDTYIKEGMSKEEAEEKFVANKDKIINDIYKSTNTKKSDSAETLEDAILAAKVENKIYSGINVSDDEIKKYYNDNMDKYVKKAGYYVRELYFPIVNGNKEDVGLSANNTFFEISKDDSNKSGDYDKIYEEAKNKTHKLSSSGEIIAQTNTISFNNANRPQNYIDSIKNLKVNSYCSPIQTAEGYYIPYIIDIRNKDKINTLEDVKSNIKDTLLNEKREKKLNDKLKEYKNEFKVIIYKDNLSF